MAYAGRRRGIAVEVFVPEKVNPVKLARMRAFGARVNGGRLIRPPAKRPPVTTSAGREGCLYVEDGKEVAIARGSRHHRRRADPGWPVRRGGATRR